MIDNPDKTKALIDQLTAHLPIRARPTLQLLTVLKQRCPDMVVPTVCAVVGLHYAGDEGGILCRLDVGEAASGVPVVSITHLTFDRTVPLAREIDAYQRHRIKKLRRSGR